MGTAMTLLNSATKLKNAVETIDKVGKITKATETLDKVNKLGETAMYTKEILGAFNRTNEVKEVRHLTTLNEHLAGQYHPETGVLYRKHTFKLNGEKVEGVFPVFDSKFNVRLPRDLYKASDDRQFNYCTSKLSERIAQDPDFARNFSKRQLMQIQAGNPRITGLVWHHNEVEGRMQLVDANDHKSPHTGGRSLWGGGSDRR